MHLWFWFALASVATLAISETAQKIALTRKEDISPAANNFVVWLLQGTMAIPLIVLFGASIEIPTHKEFWLLLAVLGIIYFVGGMLYYQSFKAEDVSISSILVSISVVVSTTIGILFFDEAVTVSKFIGLGFILAAIVAVHAKSSMRLARHHLYALAGGMVFGVAYSIDKHFALIVSPLVYVALFSYVSGLSGLLVAPRAIVKDLPRIRKNTFKAMLLSATGAVLFNTFTFSSYAVGGEVGRVDGINNTVVFLIIVIEVMIFRQRSHLLKKTIAATLALIGVYLLGVG